MVLSALEIAVCFDFGWCRWLWMSSDLFLACRNGAKLERFFINEMERIINFSGRLGSCQHCLPVIASRGSLRCLLNAKDRLLPVRDDMRRETMTLQQDSALKEGVWPVPCRSTAVGYLVQNRWPVSARFITKEEAGCHQKRDMEDGTVWIGLSECPLISPMKFLQNWYVMLCLSYYVVIPMCMVCFSSYKMISPPPPLYLKIERVYSCLLIYLYYTQTSNIMHLLFIIV